MDREEALKIVRDLYEKSLFLKKDKEAIETLIPEFKESEDERIRKNILALVKEHAVNHERCQMEAYLEKQKEQNNGMWSEDDEKKVEAICEEGNLKPSEREWLKNLKYRLHIKFIEVERVQNDEKEPMEIRYAGKVYKVHGIKEFPGGIQGYIIEDELGRYDCIINPDEVLGGYGIKSNGSPYPTKDTTFSEKSAEWSEEEQQTISFAVDWLTKMLERTNVPEAKRDIESVILGLKSFRPQPHWKPSEEQMELLDKIYHYLFADTYATADMQDGLGDFIDELKFHYNL